MDSNVRNDFFPPNERNAIVRLLKTTTSQLKLMKHLNDDADGTVSEKGRRTIDFTLKCLLVVTEEIKDRGTFDLLKEITAKERSNCDQVVTMKEQIKSSEHRRKYLNKCIKEDGLRLLNEYQFKDRIISEQSIELERLEKQNEEELDFTAELLRVQIEENELKCEIEEKNMEENITNLDNDILLESRVHQEVLFYYDNEIKRLNELIVYWKDRNKDIEERKLLLKSLHDSQREQHEELQFYVSLFKSRESEIQEYLDDKERRRKEKEYEVYLNTMATKIQCWWRGVMVRRCLGPFKHLLKIKNAKKRKMSLKKNWKYEMEKQTVCRYLSVCGEKNGIKRYFCHRSGTFESKSKNIRNLKKQGSKKIGAFCPAQIVTHKDKKNPDNPIRVEFLTTHVGHENEPCHITFTLGMKPKRSNLSNGISPEPMIIEDTKLPPVCDDFEGIHLLTDGDIHDISKEFGITAEIPKNINDASSILNFVSELHESNGDSFVLYYKPLDSFDDQFPTLSDEVFMLILMNKTQIEMLQWYGSDVVSLDGTRGIHNDFRLYSIIVLDDLREGFPCSFMVTNREDEQVLSIFFSIIRDYCGKITPKIFMSDISSQFSNAWNGIMGEPTFQFYSYWHVEEVWRKNLNKVAKIIRNQTFELLKTLLEETNVVKFHVLLGEAVNTLINDKKTASFGEYFKSNFADDFDKWSKCYRLEAGLDTNDHLERMHGTLKYVFAKGKKVGRLDKSLFFLMKFIRNKLFNRIVVENNRKLFNKLLHVRKRHSKSKDMRNPVTEIISAEGEKTYLVAASSGKSFYEVTKNPEQVHLSCKIVCEECSNACIHQYACTCVDNVIKFNMCKHIHHVIQYQLTNKNISDACGIVTFIFKSDDLIVETDR